MGKQAQEWKRTVSGRRIGRGIVIVLLALIGPASHAGRWWQEVPQGEPLAELPLDTEEAAADWELSPGLGVVEDEVLSRPVIAAPKPEPPAAPPKWVCTKRPVVGDFEISAVVRVADPRMYASAVLRCGVRESGPNPQADCSLSVFQLADYGGAHRYNLRVTPAIGDPAAVSAIKASELSGGTPRIVHLPLEVRERFPVISPVWDEAFRREIETAMAGVPLLTRTSVSLRIVRTSEVVRLLYDGLVVAERRPGLRLDGRVHLSLAGDLRVSSLVVRRPDRTPDRFYPLPLDRVCNARAMGGKHGLAIQEDSLPAPGQSVLVGGVPFVFPGRLSGMDHVDVGASLFHYRNFVNYSYEGIGWPPVSALDPMRIRFNLPNRAYRRAWIIACSDGEEPSVPVVTVRFYRPGAGWCVDAVARVPLVVGKSRSDGARRLPIELADGRKGSLWLVPVELDPVRLGSEFREELFLTGELTKEIHPFRAYPDPHVYGWFQGGLPSAVRVFAMTFEEAPIRVIASSNRTGNVFITPEEPIWQVKTENQTKAGVPLKLRVSVAAPSGTVQTFSRAADLGGYGQSRIEVPLPTSVYGLHRVRTEVELTGGERLLLEGTFVQLPRDTRKATTENSRWGLWCWFGGHETIPDWDANCYLLRAAGSRVGSGHTVQERQRWGVFPAPHIIVWGLPEWALQDPYDPKDYEKFSEETGKQVAEMLQKDPDQKYFCFFAESSISTRLTYGILPQFLGEKYELTDAERKSLRAYMIVAKAGAEGIRKHAPNAKIVLGWCEPAFTIPFLVEKYPRELMDAIGLDLCTFERMPETPIRMVTPNRLWMLKEEMRRLGYADVPLVHVESYHPSSHPLALGARTSADYYVRLAVLSLALGSTRLLNCFTLCDCADYWGSQHYGCLGMIGRRPEFNPKPAFPAYATMTRMLDLAEFDGYVPTGSASAYCVRFKSKVDRPWVYCLWTLRGRRGAALRFEKDARAIAVDENGNETPLAGSIAAGPVRVELAPTPFWIASDQPIAGVELAPPVYDERPSGLTKPLDPLDQLWTYDSGPYERYASNHWDMLRVPGPMKYELVHSSERKSKVWRIALNEPEHERKLAAWYGVFVPKQPIEIPGKARALGVWANGHSNWGRIIYEIMDAKGEIYQSIGTKDDYNCDDNHQWSYFNFDGWRYIEFPLPGHLPGDNYRDKDTVWWNCSAEGIVDLPVKLTRIIVEMRTHNIYVDQCLPVADRSVEFDDLVAVYDSAEAMTDAPIRLQREAANVIQFDAKSWTGLPNPIAQLREAGVGSPPQIAKVAPPATQHDGTRLVITVSPAPGAKEYRVYVAAYETGHGAAVMAKGPTPELQVNGLRPEIPLYLFVTALDEKGQESKPSAGRRVLLKDEFPFK